MKKKSNRQDAALSVNTQRENPAAGLQGTATTAQKESRVLPSQCLLKAISKR
jgi:hypothetical protein